MNSIDEEDGRNEPCPNCGAMPHDRAKRDDYRELRECPFCSALKCSMCDMGDDVGCGNCEGDDE